MRLLVIDGNSIANRAFYGIKLLTTKDGRYTNAIFGFLNILLSLLKECEPDEVAVAFDLKAPTFRHKMYDGYKATRHKMPDELAAQMPVLKELLAALGYREVTAEGWEADDILGTLSAACAARSDDCFLATGDRDSLQLVSDTTTVLLATTAMGRSKTVTMDVEAVKEKYGVSPRQLIDVKSLMGDTSDNIPGVKGIGEKSAVTLIQKYGSLAGVYAHLDDTADKTIKPKQREHLAEDRAMAELSYTLGTIRTDAPIDTAEGAYVVGEGNKAEAVRLMQELELHSLIARFGLSDVAPAADPAKSQRQGRCRRPGSPLCPQSRRAITSWRPGLPSWESRAPASWSCSPPHGMPCRTGPSSRWRPTTSSACWTTRTSPSTSSTAPLSTPVRWRRAAGAAASSGTASWRRICWTPRPRSTTSPELIIRYRADAAFTCEAVAGRRCAGRPLRQDEGGDHRAGRRLPLQRHRVPAGAGAGRHDPHRHPRGQGGHREVRRENAGSELEDVLTRIHMETGSASFNPNSPKQLGEMLFDTMGLPHGKKTQRGWSTDAETLEVPAGLPAGGGYSAVPRLPEAELHLRRGSC